MRQPYPCLGAASYFTFIAPTLFMTVWITFCFTIAFHGLSHHQIHTLQTYKSRRTVNRLPPGFDEVK